MARPTLFTDEIANIICERLADGQSLREVCRAEDMPSRPTANRWLRDNIEFRARYAQACQDRMDTLGDEIAEIADDGRNDWIERQDADGSTRRVFDAEHVQRSRLRIDARKWLMSKLAPRKYGDKVAIGGDADAPPVRVALSDGELARKVAFVMTRGLHDIESGQG